MKKLVSLLLALVLVLGCLPLAASAAGSTALVLDTPVTGEYPAGDSEARICVGTFTAPEEGFYWLIGSDEATNFYQLRKNVDLLAGHPGENPDASPSLYSANVLDHHIMSTQLCSYWLKKGEKIEVIKKLSVTSGHTFGELDNRSFSVTVQQAKADKVSTISIGEEKAISGSGEGRLFNTNNYHFIKFTPTEDGYYQVVYNYGVGIQESAQVRDHNDNMYETKRDAIGRGAVFLKAGHTACFSLCEINSSTVSIEKRNPFPSLTLDTEYEKTDLYCGLYDNPFYGEFTPSSTAKYIFSLSGMSDYSTFSILDNSGYDTIGSKGLNNSAQNLELAVNLEAGKTYIVKVNDSNSSVFKLNITKETLPALTGTVNITGTEKFGQTLRASVSGGNSPSNAFTYTWKRGGNTIATGAAYTLVEADIGQALTCEVTASDCDGVISKATGVISKAAGPAAPSGLEGVCPTAADTSDGKILGTTAAMEYSTDRNFASPAGTPCSANETTGLAPGTYYVRMASTSTAEASEALTVLIPAYVPPEVTSVIVSPANVQVKKGATQQFTATVSGQGAYDRTVTWSVTGGTAGTSISSTGLLTVSAEEEPATVLTVTATSVGDNTKTGTATVTVTDTPPTPPTPIGPSDPEPTVETVTTESGNTATTTTQPDGGREIEVKTPSGEVVAKVDLPADPGEGKKFADVKSGTWFETAVDKATAYGLFDGTSETTFSPNTGMNRGMVAQVLYNLSGTPGYGRGSGAFSDVSGGAWYKDAVDWASRSGVVAGVSETSYAPGRAVTREQLVTMLYRYAKAIGADASSSTEISNFPDGSAVSDYAQEAVKWAVAEKFISGRASGGKDYIAPQGTATRAEVAAILSSFVEFLK